MSWAEHKIVADTQDGILTVQQSNHSMIQSETLARHIFHAPVMRDREMNHSLKSSFAVA